MYNKILLPVDGSKNSEKAIKHATTLAIDEEAEIVILYVVDHRSLTSLPENALEDKELADYEKQGEVVTQRVVDQINGIIKETSPDKTIKTEKLIVEGNPANIIIKAIEKKDIDVEKILEEETKKLKKEMRKKNKILLIIFGCIIALILFKLLPIGYDVIHVRYEFNGENKLINLGAPKFSFFVKNNENNYSIKNLRGNNVLKSEVKNYLSSLKQISCYDTIYYYDKNTNITIVDYSVKNRLLYNNITYGIRNGNYCNELEIKEYTTKLGGLLQFHIFKSEDNSFSVAFLDKSDILSENLSWKAELSVYNDKEVIEKSSGTFKIENDELTYYRKEITINKDNLKIPSETHFVVRNNKLILKDDYLNDYDKGIILE